MVLERSKYSTSATTAVKTRMRTPTYVGEWPHVREEILQVAQHKVESHRIPTSVENVQDAFCTKAKLGQLLAIALTHPLATAPTAQLGWPEIAFRDPQRGTPYLLQTHSSVLHLFQFALP